MTEHEQHQKAGIKYQATCEECQREQLGKFSTGHIQATRYYVYTPAKSPEDFLHTGVARKQPKRQGCQ